MAFDPSVSMGNIVTVSVTVGLWIFAIGKFKQRFEDVQQDVQEIKRGKEENIVANARVTERFERLQCDVGEIKAALKKQDENALSSVKADALADGVLTLLQYRVTHLEQEMARARANIHRIAGEIHVQILTFEERLDKENELRKKQSPGG